MEFYAGDIVAALFGLFGLYAILKGRLELTLMVGPTKVSGSVDENNPNTKKKDVILGAYTSRILGLLFITAGYFYATKFKGDFLFAI